MSYYCHVMFQKIKLFARNLRRIPSSFEMLLLIVGLGIVIISPCGWSPKTDSDALIENHHGT